MHYKSTNLSWFHVQVRASVQNALFVACKNCRQLTEKALEFSLSGVQVFAYRYNLGSQGSWLGKLLKFRGLRRKIFELYETQSSVFPTVTA